MIFVLCAALAWGADWLEIQGNEPGDADAARFRPTAFLQVAVEGYGGSPVTGLESEALQIYEGERAVFDTVAPTGRPFAASLRRVRVGGRGEIPGTKGIATAAVAVELGQNALTSTSTGWTPRLVDASISLHTPIGLHARVGQFKLPLSDEALQAVHLAADTVRFTTPTGRLLMERDASSGVYRGTVNGFRDVGAQIYGGHRIGPVELSWATMASSGSVHFHATSPGVDLTGRFQVSWRMDEATRSPDREELSAWGFVQSGVRDVGEQNHRRTRFGGGVQLQRSGVRLRSEVIGAEGVLNDGVSPPFPGGVTAVAPGGSAWGVTGLASVRLLERWEVGALYGHLDHRPTDRPARRVFDELTGFVQLHVGRHLWFDLNLGWRDGRAPDGSPDAVRILDTMGPYGALMATAIL